MYEQKKQMLNFKKIHTDKNIKTKMCIIITGKLDKTTKRKPTLETNKEIKKTQSKAVLYLLNQQNK